MVRSNTFEIRWHDTQPIFSCSFQSVNAASLRKTLDLNNLHATAANQLSDNQDSASTSNASLLAASSQPWRFATAGADKHVRVWMVYPNIPSPAALANAAANATALPPRVEFLSTLTKHTNAVNAVKFSPDGERIGTAGDDGMLMVWSQTTHHNLQHNAFTDEEASYSKETWKAGHTMKITPSELYDLAWSPNGEAIAAGGTDFVVRIIDVASSSVIREILEHSLHVQGVAWDPLNEFLATQSADRSVHIFNLNTKITPTGTHSGLPGTPTTVSKNTRMELHKRSGSFGGVGGKDHSGSSSSSNNNNALAGPSNLSKSNLDISNSNPSGNTGSSSSGGGGNFIWDPQARPPMQRRGSSVSHASESGGERDSSFPPGRSGRSSTPSSVIGGSSNNPTNPQLTTAIHNSSFGASGSSNNNNRPATPTPSIPQSPFSTTSAIGGGGIPHAMNPPQRTPSRRSSFSGSNAEIDPLGSPPTSTSSMVRLASAGAPGGIPTSSSTNELINNNATASGSSDLRHGRSSSASTQGGGGNGGGGGNNLARSVRSPSPMPPLPAIRAPPSPKQRLKAAQAQLGMGHGKGMLARVQLYGDEHFTGFFRRLNFSPDGALLVTPAGIFDNNVKDSHGNNIVSPSSPTFSKDQLPSTSSSSAASPIPLSTTTNSNTKNQNSNSNATRSTVYLYGRGNFNRSNSPIAHLPGHKTASIVVKFNPILYELRVNANGDEGNKPHQTVPLEVGREKSVNIAPPVTSSSNAQEDNSSSKKDGKRARHDSSDDSESSNKKLNDESKPKSMIGLPYRMVFAVATYDSVWIYDTQQTGPLCCFSNMHYAAFTDLAWSPDGQTLMMSSTDGYCSIAVFDYNELGTPYQYSSQPSLKAPIGGNPTNILHAHGGSSAPSSSTSSSSVNNNASTSVQQQQPHSTLSQSPLGLGLTTGNPSTSTSTATTSTSTDAKDTTTNQDSSSSDQPKKKRRIQPTVQPK